MIDANAQTVTLAGGAEMPRVGLGTWPMDDGEVQRAVETAIETGYRLVDTAENYRNERGVGDGMRASGLPREALWVTSKFNREWHGEDLVRRAFDASAERLGFDTIDLMLIHWPNPDQDRYVDAWRGLIRLREAGLVRAIGVSNFTPAHLDRLRTETGVLPEVNQVQLNPYVTRPESRAYHEQHGIVTQSWSPLSKGGDALLSQAPIVQAAERTGRTPAQVVLRWHLEMGLTLVPKSTNPDRMRENVALFDFTLTRDEVDAISALDGRAGAPADSDRFGH